MRIPRYEDITADGNYLVNRLTGERVIFYDCDPSKNTECAGSGMCGCSVADEERTVGGCSKTVNPNFRKVGGRCWYAVLKTPEAGEPYWGREYIQEG